MYALVQLSDNGNAYPFVVSVTKTAIGAKRARRLTEWQGRRGVKWGEDGKAIGFPFVVVALNSLNGMQSVPFETWYAPRDCGRGMKLPRWEVAAWLERRDAPACAVAVRLPEFGVCWVGVVPSGLPVR